MDSCLTSKSKDLFHLGHKNFLQDTSLKAKEIKAKMNDWHFIKITSFCTAKQTINQTKRQPMESKKIFANDITDKGLVSTIYKELLKLDTQKMGTRNKEILPRKRHTNGQQTHEKMLHITCHRGNTNQNYNDIPPYTS